MRYDEANKNLTDTKAFINQTYCQFERSREQLHLVFARCDKYKIKLFYMSYWYDLYFMQHMSRE